MQQRSIRCRSQHICSRRLIQKRKIGRLYRSTDKGKTWDIVFEKKGVSFTNLVFDKDNPFVILAAFRNDGIYKSTDGGKIFAKKTASMGMADFSTISPIQRIVLFLSAVCQGPSPNNDGFCSAVRIQGYGRNVAHHQKRLFLE